MNIVLHSLLWLSTYVVIAVAQQPYTGLAGPACSSTANSNSMLGYSCNVLNRTCPSYLIFRSQPPFSTVSAVSALFAANRSLLSSLNAVAYSATFPQDQQIIVPITCSCSGNYSQVNITYTVRNDDTNFTIASTTFQGLSTCRAFQEQNKDSGGLFPGTRLLVPVRCACPTPSQIREGVKYLLSYPVVSGDTVSLVSDRFNANTAKTSKANGFSNPNPVIYPFTTLLIPLENPPSSNDTAVPPPSPPPPPQNGGKSNKTRLYVLVGVLAGIGVLGVLGFAIFCLVPRKMPKRDQEEAVSSTVSQSFDQGKLLEGLPSVAESLKVYKFQELRSATADFSPSRLISGSVYLGVINGNEAAIKKIGGGDVSEEINLLSKLNHFNLIRLSGFCFHDGNWYLVYEYAANGSLGNWLNGGNESCGKFLSWTQRMQIALDVAAGLNYLHNFTNPPHVHKDINTSNVLLDHDFRAKIANFRLARSTEGQNGDEFVLTRHIEGTKGYIAPEYLENGLISTKLDVYSFGVLLLEIVTGKEAADLNEHKDIWNALMSEEDEYQSSEQLIDSSLHGKTPVDLQRFVLRLLRDCLKKDHMSRPSMDDIVPYLSRILTASLTWESSYNISKAPSS